MTFLWTAALSAPLFFVFAALVRIRRSHSRNTPTATVGDWLAWFVLWVASSTLLLGGIAGLSAELAHKLGWFHLRGSPGKTAYFRLPAAELRSLKGEWTAQEGSFIAMSSVPGQPPAESRWRVVAWSDYEKRGAFFSTGGVSPDQLEVAVEGEIAVPPAPDLVGQQFEGVLEARILYPAYTYDKHAWEERTATVSIPCRVSVEAANPIRDAVNFLNRKDKERADQQGGWLWVLPVLAGALGLVPISMHGPAGFLSSLGDLVALLRN